MPFVPLAQPFVESCVRSSSASRHWQVRGCARCPKRISIAGMTRIKPAFGGHRAHASPTLLHLTVEAEGKDVLERIRAALPAGSRMEVRFVSGRLPSGATTGLTDTGFPGMSAFTGRQREVLALLIEGLSNKEIGRRLSLSHFTVRNHVSQSLRLLNVSSRKAAIERLAGLAFHDATARPPAATGIEIAAR